MTEVRIKSEVRVACLSCGQTSVTFALYDETRGHAAKATCPRCSNEAYTQSLRGMWAFQSAVAARLARIELDMIDMQDDGEDR